MKNLVSYEQCLVRDIREAGANTVESVYCLVYYQIFLGTINDMSNNGLVFLV